MSSHVIIDGDLLQLGHAETVGSLAAERECVLCGGTLWGKPFVQPWGVVHQDYICALLWVVWGHMKNKEIEKVGLAFCGVACREVWLAQSLKEVAQ